MIHLRNKIGQMLVVGFSGYEVKLNSPIAHALRSDGVGGVLLFDFDCATGCQGKNLKNRKQIKALITQLNECAEESSTARAGVPLFVALDYEGGAVDRLAKMDESPKTLKACDQAELSPKAFDAEITRMAETLNDLGFNLNFAPVVDLNLTEEHGIIGKLGRSFSSDPSVVIRAARRFVEIFLQHGLVCAYKHFPGHGSAIDDTHHGFVDVTEHYQMSELMPYQALLAEKQLPAMVMTAHVVNRLLDQSGLPTTLSSTMLTQLLRQKIGFDGVIISDDLQMQAISQHYSLDDALRLTINAGADMLIFANQLDHITATEVIDRIASLVMSGAVEASRIDEAYQRIVRLKSAMMVTSV